MFSQPTTLVSQAQTNTFPSTGSVGIGTTSPQQRLHVEGSNNQAIFVSTTAPSTTSGSGMIGSVKATPTAAGQRLGYYLMGSRGGAQNGYNQAGMVGYAGGTWSGTSHPAYLTFETTPVGSTSRVERLRITQGHRASKPQYKLAAGGCVHLFFVCGRCSNGKQTIGDRQVNTKTTQFAKFTEGEYLIQLG